MNSNEKQRIGLGCKEKLHHPQNCDHRIIVSVLPHSKIKG